MRRQRGKRHVNDDCVVQPRPPDPISHFADYKFFLSAARQQSTITLAPTTTHSSNETLKCMQLTYLASRCRFTLHVPQTTVFESVRFYTISD